LVPCFYSFPELIHSCHELLLAGLDGFDPGSQVT
jgi:hypothetical protein